MKWQSFINSLTDKANSRYDNFEIVENESISEIQEDSYLLKPKRLWGSATHTIAMVDLNNSTELSLKKLKKTVAKVYDYFTQSAFDCFNHTWYASYIDIKWDWVFAIFEGEDQLEKAFIAVTTFRKFFEDVVNPKFTSMDVDLTCKAAIYQDTLLVRKIGNARFKNEVRAGRLVTLCSKIISYPKEILCLPDKDNKSYLVVSEHIYEYYKKYYESYIINSCDCKWTSVNLWKEFDLSNEFKEKYVIKFEKIHTLSSVWCKNCGQQYIDAIL